MAVYGLGKNSMCSGTYLPFILGLYHKLWVLQPKSSSQIQMGILEFIENGIYFITSHSVSLLAMRPLPPPSPCPASLLRSNLSMSKASTLTLASKGFWFLNQHGSLRAIIMVPSRSKRPLLSYWPWQRPGWHYHLDQPWGHASEGHK